ncbi:ricin-type beta-trefoil lectin domain protein [Marinobacter sp. VGCF2001]|uniref:ricin-type beta-trefoil lectin domain protein n=1 Tax=Marinobacter sp. VGCF2001 TaxID=3417189 RepID=UPI003CFAA470
MPFATDMSGIGIQAGPRASAETDPLSYPFVTEFGLTIDRQVSGNRVFDLNTDGMAHYGLVADHIQDIREQTPARIYEAVMNSAEAYLQMWERARANTDQQYLNPLPAEFSLFNRGTGTCLDMPGNDNTSPGDKAGHYSCQTLALDQRWRFDKTTGQLSNRASNHTLCLDNNGTPWNNGRPALQPCDNSARQHWDYNGQRVTNAQSSQHSLDAYNGGAAGFWVSHGGANQQWEMRLDSASGQWAEYRSERSGQCLTSNGNNAAVSLATCTGAPQQRWQWQASAGLMISAADTTLCLASNDAPGNDVPVTTGDCTSDNARAFQRHSDGSFRLKQNSALALDAAGSSVVLYNHHGNSNQRWAATLPR